ncbi:MAG: glycyl-radical enzyme activating protein [Rectinemataceae bacterium]|jgi:pyruvate formate lyase activating enzyme
MIFDIQRFSTHDGPGIRTVVFFKGCPLACAWCENPESQSSRPELLYTRSHCVDCGTCLKAANGGALRSDPAGGIVVDRDIEPPPELGKVCPALALRVAGREPKVQEIMAEVLKDRSFFAKSGGGLTLSGGEPLAQIDLAEELLRAASSEGIGIAIETCLAVGRTRVERIADLSLQWLADLKQVDPEAFRRGTGGDVALALGNLRYLAELGADLTIRVPIVPGFNDDEPSWRGILEFAAGLPRPASADDATGRRLHLLPFHDLAAGKYAALGRSYPYPPGTKLAPGLAETIAERGRSLGLAISIGG